MSNINILKSIFLIAISISFCHPSYAAFGMNRERRMQEARVAGRNGRPFPFDTASDAVHQAYFEGRAELRRREQQQQRPTGANSTLNSRSASRPPANTLITLEQFFLQAIKTGNYQVSVNILNKNPGLLRIRGENGATPLMLACGQGSLSLVKKMLHSMRLMKMSIATKDSNGKTAIFYAAANGWRNIVELLLAANADPKAIDSQGNTLLMHAVRGGWAGTAEFLFRHGVPLESVNHDGLNALGWAALSGKEKAVQWLLSQNVSTRPLKGKSYVEMAWKQAIKTAQEGKSSEPYFLTIMAMLRADVPFTIDEITNDSNVETMKFHMVISTIYKLQNAVSLDQIHNIKSEYMINLASQGYSTRELELLREFYRKNAARIREQDIDERQQPGARDCIVCFDSYQPTQRQLSGPADCGCSICTTCARAFIRNALGESALQLCRCPGCHVLVKGNYLERLNFSDKEVQRFREHKIHRIENVNARFFPCPNKNGCPGGRIVAQGGSYYLACEYCDFNGCMKCSRDHRGKCEDKATTDEFLAMIVREGRLAPPSKYPSDPKDPNFWRGRLRPCAECGLLEEYMEGCNHFSCPKCGSQYNRNNGFKGELGAGGRDIQRYEPKVPAHF